ncbi:MAG: energy transducer TonB [Bacteroides sp.]|nr:energy transducer TonB [Roseburia sp.]MCM1346178.1 energy transducer TonB [Bacteroides sp.]MCM1420685.1 energy transducer TonB [Bacteroides sp.]
MKAKIVSALRRQARMICGMSVMWVASNSFAAVSSVDVLNAPDSVMVEEEDTDSVYLSAEVMPEFPGGMDGLMNYLGQHIVYPAEALKKNAEGRVLVTFVIEKDGHVSHASLVKPVHPSLDAEAMRVVSSLPPFNPAMDKGEPVRFKFTIPVAFRLAPPNPKK